MIEYDLSRRPGRPSEWQALAAAILESEDSEENYWLELKSRIDWSKPDAVGTLGKAVLALANRDGRRSSSALEGRGVVVVTEIETLDNADLENKLSTFVGGNDGPRWEPHWVRVDGKPVLLIEVDAPATGDPAYTLRQKFHDYRASQVFVRETGKTVLATQADMERLARRMVANEASDTLDVVLGFSFEQPLATYYWDDVSVEAFLAAEHRRLMDSLEEVEAERSRAAAAKAAEEQAARDAATGLRGVSTRDHGLAGTSFTSGFAAISETLEERSRLLTRGLTERHAEDRTPEAFKAEVERYLSRARAALPDALWTIAKRSVPIPKFWLTNLAERNYTAVEVTIRVEGQAKAESEDYEDDVNLRAMLPTRPRKYGPWTSQTALGGLLAGQAYSNFASVSPSINYGPASASRREIENGGSFRARFDAIDLRPGDAEIEVESNLAVLVPRDRAEPVVVKWEATASNVDAIQRGEFVLPFDGAPLDVLAIGRAK